MKNLNVAITFDENGFALSSGFIKTYDMDSNNIYIGVNNTYVTVSVGLPAGSYLDMPEIEAKENEVIVRRIGGWDVVPDFRGQTFYSKETGEPVVIDSLVVPNNLTGKEKPDNYSTWSEELNDWETTPENAIKKQTHETIQKKETLIALAEKRVIDLTEATDADIFDESEIDPTDIELLKLWKRYRVFIKKVNPEDLNVIWPESPEQ